jgi:hypothetical protein
VCSLVGGADHPRVWHQVRGSVPVVGAPPRHASHAVLFTDRILATDSHESIGMTLRYSHLSPDVKRDAVKLLDLPGRIPSGTLTAPRAAVGEQEEETPGNLDGYLGSVGAGKGI